MWIAFRRMTQLRRGRSGNTTPHFGLNYSSVQDNNMTTLKSILKWTKAKLLNENMERKINSL